MPSIPQYSLSESSATYGYCPYVLNAIHWSRCNSNQNDVILPDAVRLVTRYHHRTVEGNNKIRTKSMIGYRSIAYVVLDSHSDDVGPT